MVESEFVGSFRPRVVHIRSKCDSEGHVKRPLGGSLDGEAVTRGFADNARVGEDLGFDGRVVEGRSEAATGDFSLIFAANEPSTLDDDVSAASGRT